MIFLHVFDLKWTCIDDILLDLDLERKLIADIVPPLDMAGGNFTLFVAKKSPISSLEFSG